jgi:hypothetical protein
MKPNKDNDIIVNVYFSSEDRDADKYPSPSSFVIDLPDALTQVHGISISHFKFVPEKLMNYYNNTFTFTAIGDVTVSGKITINTGDYNTNINDLLAEINAQLIPYDIIFTVDQTTNRVIAAIQSGAFNTTSFSIDACTILIILGFGKNTSLTVTSNAPNLARNRPNMINDTSLILRIKDINIISSVNQYAHRATAILYCSNCKDTRIEQSNKDYVALSQVQYRFQKLNIEILNVYGHPYDLTEHNASFTIRFFCTPANLGDGRLKMLDLNTKLDPRENIL